LRNIIHEEGGADPITIRASAPYRGGKRDLYDGGIHVPMIAHWPAKIKEGRVNDTPMAFADILPTLADLAEAPKSAEPMNKVMKHIAFAGLGLTLAACTQAAESSPLAPHKAKPVSSHGTNVKQPLTEAIDHVWAGQRVWFDFVEQNNHQMIAYYDSKSW